jgi:DNA polymerase-4
MDAFYASVEQRDDASLRGRPVAVAGRRPAGCRRGGQLRGAAFGVRSAMPMAHAVRLCRHLVIVPPEFRSIERVVAGLRDLSRGHAAGRAALAR